ncbi:MAG: hypothetical protein HYY32_00330, partial [Chloroflexi bacterium]|nr:hypothetical protein [Chloroflexota bacterium]
MKAIYVSGVHSGPDPSAGVGVARSLRQAFPHATLVGVDYSAGSSGIHYEGFDSIWLQRPWNELELDLYKVQIASELEQGSLWISCLDLEAQWLSSAFPDHPGMLVPPASAFEGIAKPGIRASRVLPLEVPAYAVADRPLWDLYAFCRRHGWPVWCKGPYHEAILTWNWQTTAAALEHLKDKWAVRNPALQEHIKGSEESIVFCAYQGKVLGCVYMQKRVQTAEGKTWAGVIRALDDNLREGLDRAVEATNWTGGGELELIRDDQGNRYIMDWNPRFPAYIYGATLAGHNLPAMLAEAAGAGRPLASPCYSGEFARIVMEVPVRSQYPLPPPSPQDTVGKGFSAKHPSGMVLLARQLSGRKKRRDGLEGPAPRLPASVLEDLSGIDREELATPARVFLPRTAHEAFSRVKESVSAVSVPRVRMRVAYSVKTNPHPEMMRLALEAGFLAEAITGSEVQHALACGFSPQRIVLNGPAQGWPAAAGAISPLFAVFADSLERLAAFRGSKNGARYLGVRLRPATAASRFGANLAEFVDFHHLLAKLRDMGSEGLGIHFHIQSDVIGVRPWEEAFDAFLNWGRTLQELSGLPVRCVDVGGGWFPDDFTEELAPQLQDLVARSKRVLPDLESFLLEPGKALAQPCWALITRVLEVRRPFAEDGHVDAVVDGAISDLPLAQAYPHRLYFLRDGTITALASGGDRVLGRNCMEFDQLA